LRIYFLTDIETTGLDKDKCDIWSIASKVFTIDKNEVIILGEYYNLNKNVTIKDNVLRNKLNVDNVKQMGNVNSEKELMEDFILFSGKIKLKNDSKCFMMGYNTSFDKDFIDSKIKLYNLPQIFEPQIMDIMQFFIFTRFIANEQEYNFNLKNAVRTILNESDKYVFHDSKNDVDATFDLFISMLNKYTNFKVRKEQK